jgi:glutathione synthase/RimK-type ligase-like ATP-grasp enzyme
MERYEPEEAACLLAVRACQATGCDFAGVDLLFTEDGFLVCEVNSNAHFKNLYDCTGINTADYIMKYISSDR